MPRAVSMFPNVPLLFHGIHVKSDADAAAGQTAASLDPLPRELRVMGRDKDKG